MSNVVSGLALMRRAIWLRLFPIPATCRSKAGSMVGGGVRRCWGATPKQCSRIHSANWALGQAARRLAREGRGQVAVAIGGQEAAQGHDGGDGDCRGACRL